MQNAEIWRVALTVLTIVSPFILGGIIFWLQKHFVRIAQYTTDRTDVAERVKKDMNGIGQRINKVETQSTQSSTNVNQLERRMDALESKMAETFRNMGKIESSMEKLEAMTQQAKFDIIEAFQERTSQITEHLSQLEIFTGRLDERLKMVKEILEK